MALSAQRIVGFLEDIAPRSLAEEWDNVGLLVGSLNRQVERVLLTLDITDESVDRAIRENCELIISHHPVIFRPLKAIRTDLAAGQLIAKIVNAGITVYSAHTNWDKAANGTNKKLADAFALKEREVLKVCGSFKSFKLVVYVPVDHTEAVFSAMSRAGAGYVGNYSHCGFQLTGTGTFMPLEGANPQTGEVGTLARVQETRMETIVPERKLKAVISAMLKAHPYEEVAYDVIELKNAYEEYGLGVLGYLPEVSDWATFAAKIRALFPNARVTGRVNEHVRKVAVCGGSGGELLYAAAARGADVFITGDVSYHQSLDAKAEGIAVVDAGHYETEVLILEQWEELLAELGTKSKEKIRSVCFNAKNGPFSAL